VRLCGREWSPLKDNWSGNAALSGGSAAGSAAGNATDGNTAFLIDHHDGSAPRYTLNESSRSALRGVTADDLMTITTTSELISTHEFEAAPGAPQGSADYTFGYVGGSNTGVKCSPDFASAISLINDKGAVPTEHKVLGGVFSDSRVKVVRHLNLTLMFRIATVKVSNSVARSRLTCAAFNNDTYAWTDPQVLDVPVSDIDGYTRQDLYDYDFDAVISDTADIAGNPDPTDPDNSKACVHILMVSGRRPNGDNTAFSDAAANTVLIRANFQVDPNGRLSLYSDHASVFDSKAKYASETQPYMFLLPRMQDYDINDANAATLGIWGMAIRRVAKAGGDLVTPGQYEDMPVFSSSDFMFGSNWIDSAQHCFVETSSLADTIRDDPKNSLCLFPLSNNSGAHLLFAFFYESGDKADGSVKVVGSQVEFTTRTLFGSYSGATIKKVQTFTSTSNVFVWHGHHGVLAKSGDQLVSLTSTSTGAQAVDFTLTDVGPTGFDSDTFAVSPDGEALYFPRVRDGKLPDIDNGDGTYTPNDQRIKEYDIMAATIVQTDESGTLGFIDPYLLAQLDNAPDQLIEYVYADNFTFIYNSITDMTTSKADLWLASLPRIVCLNLMGVCAVNEFISVGANEPFHVTVKNNGNTVVEGFTLNLHNLNGFSDPGPISVTMGAGNTLVGIDDIEPQADSTNATSSTNATNPSVSTLGSDASLDAPSKAGVCIPGKEHTYVFKLQIPSDWDGRVDLQATIGDIYTSNRTGSKEGASLGASAKTTLLKYNQSPAQHSVQVDSQTAPTALAAAANNYEEVSRPYNPVDDAFAGSASGNIPQMSDSTQSLGVTAGAIAATGVAAIAASKIINNVDAADGEDDYKWRI
jgi:hypothetical protein